MDFGLLWDQENFATKWFKITFTALIHKAEIYAKLSSRKDMIRLNSNFNNVYFVK